MPKAKLKLGAIEDDKPVRVSFQLPAAVHRDLVAYAEVLAEQTGRPVGDPVKLIAPMIERFIATDRGFAKARREVHSRTGEVNIVGMIGTAQKPI